MIIKTTSIILLILVLGCWALLNGYGTFIAVGVVISLFFLPALGERIQNKRNSSNA